ncbi:choline/ethanolamine kinase family protein [Teredinibacter franksiae]|uniref:choline/ethanolamine kinase family protein n=1 Tax=Teredinibacter franksiae TaxID=2761453 RepID=UPI0016294235|nr:phosphotransferase [Teredinibacter franksiae]
MTNEASKQNRIRLANALSTWHSWHVELSSQPRVLRDLSSGTTNSSYIVGSDKRKDGISWPAGNQKKYCLRLNADNSTVLGIKRETEYTILEQLKGTGLSPKILHYNTKLDFCVFEYITGRSWSRSDLTRLTQRRRLEELLTQVQRVRVKVPACDYLAYVQNYLNQIERLAPDSLRVFGDALPEFLAELKTFMVSGWTPVLCHHDLIPENILETDDGLVLLDWEYASLGHPDFDQRYVRHCLDSHFEQSQGSLLSGDTLDRLIYWLVILWQKLGGLTVKA